MSVAPRSRRFELVQLAALPLPADPRAFALVPHAAAVREEESRTAARRGAVSRVETRDALARRRENGVVAGRLLAGRIVEVGDERVVHIAFGVRDEVHFEPLDLFLRILAATRAASAPRRACGALRDPRSSIADAASRPGSDDGS